MKSFFYCILLIVATSCASYHRNIMFTPSDSEALKNAVTEAEQNYKLRKNDRLLLYVYTSGGERIIDPDFELQKDIPPSNPERPEHTYLIESDGAAKLPKLGRVSLEGLTIAEAEDVLEKKYDENQYVQTYVILKCVNNRAVVLGAPGGQVIPLENENMRLTEVLALAHGIGNDARADNIRIIHNNEIFISDLSSFQNFQSANRIIYPDDIIYVEPVRRPLSEGLRDYGPLLSILTSLTTLLVVLFGI